MEEGYLCMVLHTHLPYVNHPENDNFIEEKWLYEAISEVYIPLIKYFSSLVEENVKFRITMSLTPTLLEMLVNEVQQEKYIRYLEKQIELSSKEVERTTYNPDENNVARYYFDRYSNDLYLFRDVYNRDLISQFKRLQDSGVIEIITCCATHGFLPMLVPNEKCVENQIKYGVLTYKKYFGKMPRGIWLAECGYVPEVEKYLKKYGIEYFLTEMHGVIYARPVPVYGMFVPIVSPNGIAVFGRNVPSTMQVWSNMSGYPGDSNYREFSRDIGYDLDYDYIRPYITYDGVRIPTGIKYYSVSGKQNEKWIYNLQRAKETAETHSFDYMQKLIAQVESVKENMKGKKPIIVSMQDAELYGHWWYEGPYWLYILIKKLYYDQNKIGFMTPSDYIDKYPEMQECKPNISSWGAGGTNLQWAKCWPQDIYVHLEMVTERMFELADEFYDEKDSLKIRVLNQCARELLLLQNSDWYFNLTVHRVEDYSRRRIKGHIDDFNNLYEQIKQNNINQEFFFFFEYKDAIFKDIDFRHFKNM